MNREESETIKIGGAVVWRGSFGEGTPLCATVKGLTLTGNPREKYGIEVNEVHKRDVRDNRVLFDLDNNHWCYSDQIDL